MLHIRFAICLAGLATICMAALVATTDAQAFRITDVSLSDRPECTPAARGPTELRAAAPAAMSSHGGGDRAAAFTRLLASADAFARAVAANEIDHSAEDVCAAPAVEAAEKRIFVRTLNSLVAGERSDAPPLTFPEADGALNAAYRQVMAVGDPEALAWGSVDKPGIRRTERTWLAYRDAFVAFAATLDQPGAAERVKIELTARRAMSLETFLAD